MGCKMNATFFLCLPPLINSFRIGLSQDLFCFPFILSQLGFFIWNRTEQATYSDFFRQYETFYWYIKKFIHNFLFSISERCQIKKFSHFLLLYYPTYRSHNFFLVFVSGKTTKLHQGKPILYNFYRYTMSDVLWQARDMHITQLYPWSMKFATASWVLKQQFLNGVVRKLHI